MTASSSLLYFSGESFCALGSSSGTVVGGTVLSTFCWSKCSGIHGSQRIPGCLARNSSMRRLNFLRSFRKNCRLIRGFNDHLAAAHELNRAVARGQVQFECRLVPKEGRIELRLETD